VKKQLKKLLFILLFVPLVVFGQTFVTNNLQVSGAVVNTTGAIPLIALATQAANTILANGTGVVGSPTAIPVPSCAGTSSALTWQSSSGFACNTAIVAASASSVSGVVPIVNGGTGATTAVGATANLQYNQGNSGAVTRSDTNRLQDYVSVLDFGASNAGVIDATGAINAAIGGGFTKLYFPPGIYNIAGVISYNSNGLHLVGAGRAATTLSSSCATCDVILFGNGTANPSDNSIEDMTISASVTKTSGAAIHFRNGHHLRVMGVTISNQSVGFDFDGGAQQFEYYLDDYEINSGTVGIRIGQDGTLNQDIFIHDGVIGSQSNAAVYLINVSGFQMRDSDLINNNIGVTTQGVTSGDFATALVFDNVQADTSTTAGFNFVSNGGNVSDVRCINCWGSSTNVASNSAVGFNIQQFSGTVNGVNLVAPHAINNGGDGIFIQGGTNIAVSDFQTFQNSVAATGTKHGIEVAAGASNFSIVNGQSGDGGKLVGSNKQSYGVLVDTGSSNNYLITNVNCGGNLNGCVSDGGSGGNKIVSGNINH